MWSYLPAAFSFSVASAAQCFHSLPGIATRTEELVVGGLANSLSTKELSVMGTLT
jgi:hypothetical protein